MQSLNISQVGTIKHTLLLDLDQHALSFQVCRGEGEIDFRQDSAGKPPAMLKTAGDPRTVLYSILSSLAHEDNLSETKVVFGCYSDPFLYPEKSFDYALKIIEILLSNNPGKLIIKTSSPLVFLAVPLLINSKNKVQFETKKEYAEKLSSLPNASFLTSFFDINAY